MSRSLMSFSRRQCYLALAGVLAVLVLMADQASKFWALEQYEAMMIPRPVMGGLNWVLVWNRGMSFGVLNNGSWWGPWVLTAVAGVLLVVLARWLWTATHALQATALGLIIGGAVGNVVDRFQHGAVVDFIDVYWQQYHWPAFNVADSAICVGVVLLILETIVQRKDVAAATEPTPPTQEITDDANE